MRPLALDGMADVSKPASTSPPFDVVVVGTGVAGLTTALRLLDGGARVALIDKERRVGGNSAKASSGINGCCPQHSRGPANQNDTVGSFTADTARSAQREAGGLISVLASSSQPAIEWLLQRTSIDLSKVKAGPMLVRVRVRAWGEE